MEGRAEARDGCADGASRRKELEALCTELDGQDGQSADAMPATPLPEALRLAGDANADVSNWYAATFSSELSEVKKSMKIAKVRMARSNSKAGTRGAQPVTGAEEEELLLNASDEGDDDIDSSISSTLATKLEIALLEAKERVHSEAQKKEALEERLACVEEMEELRMKLSSYELQEILDQKAERTPNTIHFPVWARDEDYTECKRCKGAFSFMNRKHHCRKCGFIFCEGCAPRNNVAPLPQLGYTEPVRHCFGCLPLPAPEEERPASYRVSSANTHPYSGAVERIRRLENACLRKPSSAGVVQTLQAYVGAIERIAKSENLADERFRKASHGVLLRSMHAFLQMPPINACLSSDSSSMSVIATLVGTSRRGSDASEASAEAAEAVVAAVAAPRSVTAAAAAAAEAAEAPPPAPAARDPIL